MDVSDDEDDENQLLAERRRDRNKITVRDKKILDNVQKNIRDCADKLTASRPVLQETRDMIQKLRLTIKGITSRAPSILALKAEALTSMENLEARWTELSSLLVDDEPVEFSTGTILFSCITMALTCYIAHHFVSNMYQSNVVIQIVIFLGIFLTGVIGASRNDGDFVMGVLNILIFQVLQPLDGGLFDIRHEDTISQLPNNIRAALGKFDIDTKTVVYAVCPKCHCTFSPQMSPGDPVPKYPSHCTNHPTPGSEECGQPLLRHDPSDKEHPLRPIKPFVYHSFHDYLAGLLSRKDLEEAMDKACDRLKDTVEGSLPEFVSDVWGAEFLRSFKGPTPGAFVIDRGNEGRYVFSLNVDFFNIEGMRIRGASTSCGLIAMVCLNLPPDIRYKPEYMYVAGIIPGPNQPKETELNHYIRPLVDDMEKSWTNGVKYSVTACCPNGRMTRCAIAIAGMDLPAARHTSQLAGHSAHIYCTICQCRHRQTLGRVDYRDWELRDDEKIRQHAEEWRDATTLKDRVSIFDKYGTRYSELWRLPYWTPSRQLIVDPMHALFETLFPVHFRRILRLTSADAATPEPPIPAFSHNFLTIDENDALPEGMSAKEVKQVGAIHKLLTESLKGESDEPDFAPLHKRLMDKNTEAIKFVCIDLNIQPTPTFGASTRIYKKDWVSSLVKWVSFVCLSILHCFLTTFSAKLNLFARPTNHPLKSEPLKRFSASRT